MPVFSGPFTTYYEDMEILNKLKEVDGSGSGLDADTLDTFEASSFATITYTDATFPTVPASTIANNFVTFTTDDGLVLGDSGYNAASFATVGHTQLASTIEFATGATIPATYHTLQDYMNIQGAGRISGGVITSNGDGTVAVSAGYGLIKTGSDYIDDTVFINWPTTASVSLTDNLLNYIYLTYNSGTPTVYATITRSDTDLSLDIAFGRVFRSGTTLSIIQSGNEAFCITSRVHERLILTDGGLVRASGGVISATGTRNIASTAGSFYIGLNNVTTAAKDTSVSDTFTYWYRNGSGGWTSVASQTQINNTQYDDGTGTLNDLSDGRYGVHWIFIRFDGQIDVVYGQGDYVPADAISASLPVPVPTILRDFAILAAKIVIVKNASTFYSNTSAYATVFPINTPFNHNDLGLLQGGTASEYYHLTATEYNTTVPKYYGESATEPATFKPGDEYWDTSSVGVLKKYISVSVGWKTITTT
ncbi:MAG: hypothetical protein WC877_00145 [Dehalococcoidales bacterium]|jgi:hypothetical protein